MGLLPGNAVTPSRREPRKNDKGVILRILQEENSTVLLFFSLAFRNSSSQVTWANTSNLSVSGALSANV